MAAASSHSARTCPKTAARCDDEDEGNVGEDIGVLKMNETEPMRKNDCDDDCSYCYDDDDEGGGR